VYYLKRYAGSQPFYCKKLKLGTSKKKTQVCNIKIGDTYGYPIFAHYGYESGSKDVYCDCTTTYQYCNVFDLMTGFIYRADKKFVSANLALKDQWKILREALNGNGTTLNKKLGTKYRVYAVNTYDSDNQNVNNYLYQLGGAHCRDTFSMTKKGYQNALATPPVKLTQDFYECLPTPQDAALQSLGIAQGNATLFSGVALTMILMAASYFGLSKAVAITFSDDEKAETLDALAYELRLIDNPYFYQQAGPGSVLAQLHDDIARIREARGGDEAEAPTKAEDNKGA
jgi:hypothetical protein